MAEEPNDTVTLLKYLPKEQHPEFLAYVKELVHRPQNYGDIDYEFLGFIDDYVNYAALLQRKVDIHESLKDNPLGIRPPKGPITVYDVGCAHALQHLVFDPRIHYVGIDVHEDPPPRFFRPNCTFIKGKFGNIADTLNVDRESAYGIANMSLAYVCQEDLPIFDRTFKRKFVL